jgi:hypothetical protein
MPDPRCYTEDPVSVSPVVTSRAKLFPAAFSPSFWLCRYTAAVKAAELGTATPEQRVRHVCSSPSR